MEDKTTSFNNTTHIFGESIFPCINQMVIMDSEVIKSAILLSTERSTLTIPIQSQINNKIWKDYNYGLRLTSSIVKTINHVLKKFKKKGGAPHRISNNGSDIVNVSIYAGTEKERSVFHVYNIEHGTSFTVRHNDVPNFIEFLEKTRDTLVNCLNFYTEEIGMSLPDHLQDYKPNYE